MNSHATTAPSPTLPLDIRADFPILKRRIDGRPLIYLDSAASSQKPAAVIEAIDDYYRAHNANIHRGVYTLAQEATEMFEGARARVAAFCGGDTATTIFTRNGTEAINLVAYAWGREHVGRGDVVLITEMEHHSNIVPWQLLGTINPVTEMVARVRAAGAVSLIDGCQGVPQLPVEVSAIDADFYAWTGHKALGPTGIGVLHGRRQMLEDMRPFLGGGDMIRTVDFQTSTWNELPWKFEAGTSMVAEGVGLGTAVDYLSALGMENVRAHERELTRYALERLDELSEVRVIGPSDPDARGGVISFEVEGIHPHDVADLINRENVCVRAGHHCAMPLMRRLGVPATARASFGPYNIREDVDALIAALAKARQVFGIG
jgi:cysteine desulfurase/selenocysteine lyase